MTYYKLVRPDGTDFHTGTVDYSRIGEWVVAPDWNGEPVCGGGLHFVADPLDAFRWGAGLPCRVFVVRPGRERVSFEGKHKAAKLRVLSEVTDLDELFGFAYSEAVNPVHPFEVRRRKPEPTRSELEALVRWASVGASVGASAWDSVWASVWASAWDSVWDSVGASVWALVGASVWALVRASARLSVRNSVRNSVRDSVGDSVGAYVGSLFPSITDWQNIDHEPGVYPFADGAWLLRRGLVPAFDGKTWRLHAGPDARVVWEGTL